MDIWVTGIVMAGLGYWAAHIRLTHKRNNILLILSEARAILAKLEADRSKGGGWPQRPPNRDWGSR